ncbi:choline TMA-lyase-activating enzyme [Desulforamulus hydrothermalis]|uniref:Choline trimethylamine-lyase activating enzyme n=1 Tax=Desulforamulus hydrothermalis Lam5 = DSM 18033 TaxID=1121428 RepID=K8E889_9FIRM|nr:choline TMA-lyase-activating enzyme [Desulforamulus hydrothermalis]CCO07718.1 putative AdoMet-dependent glycyl radical activating enzyme [Desulforamulus hydrothermalis Lam5 = DSM 18033]SHH33688.1 pyruvate formate lyase activating enzyme [Desulforamulus hydrothermalis Lam5 = DSM 18033]
MNTETISILERKARIFNVQKYSIYDGPGVRTLIFFKGCPLRCKWCSNPEGLERKFQVMFKEDLCINCGSCIPVCPLQIHYFTEDGKQVKHQVNRSVNCAGCRKCESVCPRQALSIAGSDKTVSEVLAIIQQDALFYLSSGGGVTLGGGEVTAQPEFAANLLTECKRLGIHTAIETSGYAKLASLLKVAEFTDLILFDLKHIDPERHFELTGVHNERILDNLAELISRGFTVKVRMPILKGLNDSAETIHRTMNFLQTFKFNKNFLGVDLLPYHKLGINKYKQLGLTYPLTEDVSISNEEMQQIVEIIKGYGLPVDVIGH